MATEVVSYREFINENNITVYLDMDGVLADFVKYTNDLVKGKFEDTDWDKLPVDMYAKLPLMKDAKELFNYVTKHYKNVEVLTAYPKPKRGAISKSAPKDKKAWMKKHFGVSPSKVHTVFREQKKDYADVNAILIDDHKDNIKEFSKAGGVGIHHINTKNTIKKLKELGL